jgi:hypothetical protein
MSSSPHEAWDRTFDTDGACCPADGSAISGLAPLRARPSGGIQRSPTPTQRPSACERIAASMTSCASRPS